MSTMNKATCYLSAIDFHLHRACRINNISIVICSACRVGLLLVFLVGYEQARAESLVNSRILPEVTQKECLDGKTIFRSPVLVEWFQISTGGRASAEASLNPGTKKLLDVVLKSVCVDDYFFQEKSAIRELNGKVEKREWRDPGKKTAGYISFIIQLDIAEESSNWRAELDVRGHEQSGGTHWYAGLKLARIADSCLSIDAVRGYLGLPLLSLSRIVVREAEASPRAGGLNEKFTFGNSNRRRANLGIEFKGQCVASILIDNSGIYKGGDENEIY